MSSETVAAVAGGVAGGDPVGADPARQHGHGQNKQHANPTRQHANPARQHKQNKTNRPQTLPDSTGTATTSGPQQARPQHHKQAANPTRQHGLGQNKQAAKSTATTQQAGRKPYQTARTRPQHNKQAANPTRQHADDDDDDDDDDADDDADDAADDDDADDADGARREFCTQIGASVGLLEESQKI